MHGATIKITTAKLQEIFQYFSNIILNRNTQTLFMAIILRYLLQLV